MKSFSLVTLLACALVQASFGASIAGDAVTANIDFGTALKMFYISFQRIMPCGDPQLNLPVLAPFTLDYYPISFSNENYK